MVFAGLAVWQAQLLPGIDRTVLSWVTSWETPVVTAVMKGITFLGEPVWFAALCVLILLLTRFRRWGWLFTVNALLVGIVNQGLKAVFERARPAIEAMLAEADGYSFPSGHAMGSMAIYGLLICMLLRLPLTPRFRRGLTAGLAVLIGAIGFSRVYLRVHYTTDVLAGWCAGLVYLLLLLTGAALIRRGWRRRSVKP